MFLDASVIVAILGREPDHEELETQVLAAIGAIFVSPLVKFEAAAGLARQKTRAGAKPTGEQVKHARAAVEALLADLDAVEVDVTPEIGDLALQAAGTYGKLVGHEADLNFGDCFAYACAKHLGVRLLYKGADFLRTDLR